MKKWILKIKESISEDIAQDLANSAELFNEMNKKLEGIQERLENVRPEKLKKKKKQDNPTPESNRFTKKFEFNEIGIIHTPYNDIAPYQPLEDDRTEGDFQIIIDPKYMDGLFALDKFRYIYVIYYIHRISREMKNIVSPPWTDGHEVGVFASRSPLRPNLIGISIVQIIQKLVLKKL